MEVCIHLENILEYEIARGNTICQVDDNWSSGIKVITLNGPIDSEHAKALMEDNQLKYWENHDSHYPIQKGFLCRQCNQSLASSIE